MKNAVTIQTSNTALQPVIDYCQQHRGSTMEIRRRFCRATGREWPKNTIMRWLHRDPDRRIEPLFGSGLLLLHIGREVMRQGVTKKDQRSNPKDVATG
jgi:hypothetical protein